MSVEQDIKLLKKRIEEVEKELVRLKYLVEDIQANMKPIQLPRLLMKINTQ